MTISYFPALGLYIFVSLQYFSKPSLKCNIFFVFNFRYFSSTWMTSWNKSISIDRLLDRLQYPFALNKQSIVTFTIFGDRISKIVLIWISLTIILFEVGLEGKFFSSTTKLLSVILFIFISVSVLLSRLKKDEDCNLLSTRKWF